jgi:ankyrin repeat protein
MATSLRAAVPSRFRLTQALLWAALTAIGAGCPREPDGPDDVSDETTRGAVLDPPGGDVVTGAELEAELERALRADDLDLAGRLLSRGAPADLVMGGGEPLTLFIVRRASERVAVASSGEAVDRRSAAWVRLVGPRLPPGAIDAELSGQTPLHRAAGASLPMTVETLIRHGARYDLVRAGDGLAPLEIAARMGQLSVLEVLARAGARLPGGPCPEDPALDGFRFELLPGEAEARARLRTLHAGLTRSGSAGDPRNALCESAIEVEVFDAQPPVSLPPGPAQPGLRRALARALQREGPSAARWVDVLLRLVRPEPGHMVLAARHGSVDALARLLLAGLSVRGASGRLPLCEAAARGHLPVVDALLRAGAVVTGSGEEQPVLCAVKHASADGRRGARTVATLARLEEAGARLDVVDGEGESALHHAARAGDTEVCMWLAARGLNPESRSTGPLPMSARALAAAAGHEALAARLASPR